MNRIFSTVLAAALVASSFGFASQAEAKGCVRGAIAGGVAGHAVHHTWTGAVAGCLAARHYYKQKRLQEQQQRRQIEPQGAGGVGAPQGAAVR